MRDPVLLRPNPTPPGRRWLMILVAVAITAGLLAVALFLGDWARRTRSTVSHEERLSHLVAHKPPPQRNQVAMALRDEGRTEQATARTAKEREALAARWGGPKRGAVLSESARWARTDVFTAPDGTYILYFDEQELLRAFTFVSP
jgi:hypothetical protein